MFRTKKSGKSWVQIAEKDRHGELRFSQAAKAALIKVCYMLCFVAVRYAGDVFWSATVLGHRHRPWSLIFFYFKTVQLFDTSGNGTIDKNELEQFQMRTEDIEQFDEELWNIVKAGINGHFDLICVPG